MVTKIKLSILDFYEMKNITVFYTGNENRLTVTNIKFLELPVNADIILSD